MELLRLQSLVNSTILQLLGMTPDGTDDIHIFYDPEALASVTWKTAKGLGISCLKLLLRISARFKLN